MSGDIHSPESGFSIALALREGEGPPRWVDLTIGLDLPRVGPYVDGLLVRRGMEGLLLQPDRAEAVYGGEQMLDHASRRIAAWRDANTTERHKRSFRSPARWLAHLWRRMFRNSERGSRASDFDLVDAETGLPNRLHADLVLNHFVGAASRGEPLTLVLLTLDLPPSLFSADALGERVADAAHRLVAGTRAADLVARYDAKTFLLGLPRCDSTGARRAISRLQRQLEIPFMAGVGDFGPETPTVEALMARANEALRKARGEESDSDD
jgi:GGDEF domain-containing protein